MEENSRTQQDPNQLYARVKHMLTVEKKNPEEIVDILMKEGVDQDSAAKLVNYAAGGTGGSVEDGEEYYEEEDDDGSGVMSMVIGGIFCIGGIIATVADIGYIFYGAIIFGGIQFIKGLIKVAS